MGKGSCCMKKAILVVGTRPNFIKCAPLYRALVRRSSFEPVLVHTGQHYDPNMSDVFLSQLGLPRPKYNLEAGSGTHGEQTGRMLAKMDKVLEAEEPDVVVVMGDTNTTLAGALSAYKLGFPIAHVEAGMREFIWRPEEINKKIADHCSDFCFCPTPTAVANLVAEGIPKERIFLTGDITYDAYLQATEQLDPPDGLLRTLGVQPGNYALMTLHRAETVDRPDLLAAIVEQLVSIDVTFVFPVHPRTRRRLEEFGLISRLAQTPNVRLMDPVGYFEFLALMLSSRVVVTDSSGVLKDAFYSRRPCLVVDETTEYVELLPLGMTVLVGRDGRTLRSSMERLWNMPFEVDQLPLGDGHAAEKMVDILSEADLASLKKARRG